MLVDSNGLLAVVIARKTKTIRAASRQWRLIDSNRSWSFAIGSRELVPNISALGLSAVEFAPPRIASMGIDVAIARRLDIVVLDDALRVVFGPENVRLIDLRDVIRRTKPDVIAIDSPPTWGLSGKARTIERELQAVGISIFPTPAAEFKRDLHRWMEAGFKVFSAVRDLGYPLYTGGTPSARSAIEVFPHASAVVLRGSLAQAGVRKYDWRRSVLEGAGVSCIALQTTDHLDAALAALTGVRFLDGNFCLVGSLGEAVLVLPVNKMPTRRYARDSDVAVIAASDPHKAIQRLADVSGRACDCGCGALVRRRYLPGHDAKHRSRLLAETRAGNAAAADELQRLGWVPI